MMALDMLDALSELKTTGNSKRLDDALASWYATAEVGLDNETIEEIRAGQEEIQSGESVQWMPGRFLGAPANRKRRDIRTVAGAWCGHKELRRELEENWWY